MKNYEALELQAKAMRLVEGTELNWWCVIRRKGTVLPFTYEPSFNQHISEYELALAIVEGKPVFKDDYIWYEGYSVAQRVDAIWFNETTAKECSWSPPKPRTVLVELLVEDVKFWQRCQLTHESPRLAAACRKALETLK